MQPAQVWVDANGVRLSVLCLGPADATPVVLLHGMRDVAESLMPVALALAPRYRVILPELRGHGASDQPGTYTMEHYLFDMVRILDVLGLERAHWFGHSLGGQILVRLAAMFPERVCSAIVVEGLGPPDRPGENDDAVWLAGRGPHLLASLSIPQRQRPLPDLAFAAGRLKINNPRLDPARAKALAGLATRRTADGDLVWAFDPRVQTVFAGATRRVDTERYWRNVRCPTLVISGDLAHEYWRSQIPAEWDGHFAPGELAARIQSFRDHEHVEIEGAGHMVHFDQPEALIRATLDFLERRA